MVAILKNVCQKNETQDQENNFYGSEYVATIDAKQIRIICDFSSEINFP